MSDVIPNDEVIPAKELQKIQRKQAYELQKKLAKEKKRADKELILEKKLREKQEKDELLWRGLKSAKELSKTSDSSLDDRDESTKEPGI